MMSQVGSEKNIMHIRFAFDEELLKETTGDGFVVFDGHSLPF
jgi:hypothetical protein